MSSAVEGGCFCGAIRYRATSPPDGSTICHCHSCRTAAGAPVVAWVTFPAQAFSLLCGRPAEFRSSPPVVRTFCTICGTPLTYTHAARPSEIDVTMCSLDDPEAFPPSHHIWLHDKLEWVRFGDGLPAHDETRKD